MQKWISRPNIFIFCSTLFFIGLFYSKFLLSLCLFGFAAVSLINNTLDFSFDHINQNFRRYTQHGKYWLFALVFLGILFSGINSENMNQWLKNVQLKLPFVVLPFVFVSYDFIEGRLINKLKLVFVSVAVCSSLIVGLYYLGNPAYYIERIGKGQSLEVPVHHVTYSLLISFAVLVSIAMLLKQKTPKKRKILIGIAGVFLFGFQHILAVRSGLTCSYVGLALLLSFYFFKRKNYFGLLLFLLGLIAIPIVAYLCIPSFYAKIGYVVWDLTNVNTDKVIGYSDGGRWVSWQMGWDIFKGNLFFGTGIGDLPEVCERWYLENISGYSGKLNLPHNQILYCLSSMGIVGTTFFLLGIFIPFFKAKLFKNNSAWLLYLIVVLSFLVETQIERSVFINFFLFFALIFIAEENESH